MNRSNLPTVSFSRFLFFIWSFYGIWAGHTNNTIAMDFFAIITLVFSCFQFIQLGFTNYIFSKLRASDFYCRKDNLKSALKETERYGTLGYYLDCTINVILAIGLIFVGYIWTPSVLLVLLMFSAASCSYLIIKVNGWIKELETSNPIEYKL